MAILPPLPKQWRDLSVIQKTALWQAPLIGILSLEIGFFMWGLWLAAWGMSFLRRWWWQLPVLAGLIAITAQLVPLRSADFFILILVILLPFTWRLDEGEEISPAGLCPTIFLAGSVFIFQSQFIILLGLVAWLLAFLLWFATALTGFRLSAISVRWVPIIAGSAVTAAVIVMIFTIIPRLSTGFIPSFATASQQIGLTDELSPGGMSDLLASQDVAFRAVPRNADQPAPLYWRVYALTRQDGNKWRRSGSRAIENDFLVRDEAQLVRYQILTDTHDLTTIPLPGFPASSAQAVAAGYGYNHHGEALLSEGRDTRQITLDALNATSHRYDYPASTALSKANPRLQAYGKQMRAAYPDDKAFVAALMASFADEFLYNTQVAMPEKNALDYFFFEAKTGFCSYFATSLATMLRAGGLEAHIVTGYMGGEWNQFGKYWLVKQSDAHAWVEVRLSDGLWHRLDPTLEAMQLATPRFSGLSAFGETELEGRDLRVPQKEGFYSRLEQAVAFVDSLNLRVTLAIMNYGDQEVGEGSTDDGEDRFALLLAGVGLSVTIIFVIYTIMKLAGQSAQMRPTAERALERLVTNHSTMRLSGESLFEHVAKIKQIDHTAYDNAMRLAYSIYQARFAARDDIVNSLSNKKTASLWRAEIKQVAKRLKEAKKASFR